MENVDLGSGLHSDDIIGGSAAVRRPELGRRNDPIDTSIESRVAGPRDTARAAPARPSRRRHTGGGS